MNISSVMGASGQSYLGVSGRNGSAGQHTLNAVRGLKGNRDRVSLSPQGKRQSMIQNLMKQKDMIMERKNELVQKTTESGGDLDSIKGQLDLYAEQLKNIDKQISDIYTQQAKEAVEKKEDKKSGKQDTNKTGEQVEVEYLSHLSNMREKVKQSEKISGIKNRVEGEVRVKEAEVGMAELHVDMLESKGLDGKTNVADKILNEKGAIEEKKGLISELKEKSLELTSIHGNTLGETIEKLDKEKDTQVDKASSQEDSDHMEKE